MDNITSKQFDSSTAECKDIFMTKMKDYGTAWRILRTPSLTDQIYIKANRIRSIEEKGMSKVKEGVKPEFIGIINYSVMALIQLELGDKNNLELNPDEAVRLYDSYIQKSKEDVILFWFKS